MYVFVSENKYSYLYHYVYTVMGVLSHSKPCFSLTHDFNKSNRQ